MWFLRSSEAVGAWDESPEKGFGKETETGISSVNCLTMKIASTVPLPGTNLNCIFTWKRERIYSLHLWT